MGYDQQRRACDPGKVKDLQYISPVLFAGGNDKNVVRGEKNGSYLVKGCYPEYDLIEKAR